MGNCFFVENIGDINIVERYYYIYYGKMPDGAIVVCKTINAETGKIPSGAIIGYYSEKNRVYILSPEEAKQYAMKALGLKEELIERATFYFDWDSMNYDEMFDWKYEIRAKDNKSIKTGKEGV
ncbi:MAG: hypothetical protein ACP5QT_05220 [Brevinematia bacterium]